MREALICTHEYSQQHCKVLQGPTLKENADMHIPTGAGPLTSRGDLVSKGLLEFSIWQDSPSLAFLFLKVTPFPYSLPFIPAAVTRRPCHLAHLSPATCHTVSQPESPHPCKEGRWTEPHPLQWNGCTKECTNPMLPGAYLIYSYKQHPSSHTVPFLNFIKHRRHMWVFIN